MRRVLPLKKAKGRLDKPRLTLVALPNCMKTGLSKPRLAGKEGYLHKQHRHAGQTHPLSVPMKPCKGGGTEFDDNLIMAELKFHDVLLFAQRCPQFFAGLPNYLQAICQLPNAQAVT